MDDTGTTTTTTTTTNRHYDAVRLTTAALQEHNASQSKQLDTSFAQSAISAESTQQVERMASIGIQNEARLDLYGDELRARVCRFVDNTEGADSAVKLYTSRSTTSVLDPMQRFAFSSSTLDPFVAQHGSSAAGVCEDQGSFGSLRRRTAVAVNMAAEGQTRGNDSGSTMATKGSRSD